MDGLLDLFSDHTLRTVALGAAILGVVSGVLGSFAVLRGESLLGDAISHAALPGIVVAFLVTGSKSPVALVLGAAAAGWLASLAIAGIVRSSRIKYDAALGAVLSVFFGAGLALLTYVQKRPDAAQAGLDDFLFGQAAALLSADVRLMAILGGLSVAVTALMWKELKLISFDPSFAATLGWPATRIEGAFTALLVIAIVIGLQTVGVVLMSALVVAPAAAARQWTERLGVMVVLAAVFGALSGITGGLFSSNVDLLPTGPTIVVVLSAIVLLSLMFGASRGLVWRHRRARRAIGGDAGALLDDLYVLSQQHDDRRHAHSSAVLRAMRPDAAGFDAGLRSLEERGLAERSGDDGWRLTDRGREVAETRESDA